MVKRMTTVLVVVAGLMYPVLFILTLGILPFLKQVVTGHDGPNTAFFCAAIINPLCFLALGIALGRHMAIVHAGIAILMSIWIYIHYPIEPLMNFRRQMAYTELPGRLLIAYLAGFSYYIIYSIVRKKMQTNSNKPDAGDA
ncbi:MAG: hypothetical protein ACOYLM_11350 [Methylococcaceae bacterium]